MLSDCTYFGALVLCMPSNFLWVDALHSKFIELFVALGVTLMTLGLIQSFPVFLIILNSLGNLCTVQKFIFMICCSLSCSMPVIPS